MTAGIGFYVLCGVAAAVAHAWLSPDSVNPLIGASGGVSGVLGAFLILYPRSEINVAVPIAFGFRVVRLPTLLVLVAWFALQFFLGFGSVAADSGISFFAHIGGFISGMILTLLFVLVFPLSTPVVNVDL